MFDWCYTFGETTALESNILHKTLLIFVGLYWIGERTNWEDIGVSGCFPGWIVA
jgi:hypothetical protein